MKSGKIRIVIRTSLKAVTVQAVQYKPDGDKVLMTVSSRHLQKKYGLKKLNKNITTGYLTGLIAGKKARDINISEAIADFGLKRPHNKGVAMAVLKGLIDSGMKIPCNESKEDPIFPAPERISGNHLKNKINLEEIKARIK